MGLCCLVSHISLPLPHRKVSSRTFPFPLHFCRSCQNSRQWEPGPTLLEFSLVGATAQEGLAIWKKKDVHVCT